MGYIHFSGWLLTQCHRLGGFSRNLFSSSSGGEQSEIEVLAGLVSPEASAWLAAEGLSPSLSSYGLSSVRVCVLIQLEGHQSCWVRERSVPSFILNDF